ncbi:VOC family protein [Streptomyces clavifer]|uniref:VOC family protein n=1 Tax=Streptomyces clavifer TaxID=68188 RepID=UPI0033AD7904
MLRGLTTVRFHASDLPAAKRWYTELLGVEPYFERPGYAEFRIREFGEGFVGASVLDPFGNVLGLMRNQHYPDGLATRPGEAVPHGARG